jgi:hypothetical protein
MLEDVHADNVATVIIKDQSRIGRDVLEVGLLKRQFEEHNVRFIAANDNLDTANGYDIMSVFRDVFNEYYVADCSKKIRAVKRSNAIKGKSMGRVHYGYRAEGDKSIWYLDDGAAENIAEIFKLYISGMKIAEICRYLSDKGVPTPDNHRLGKSGGVWGVTTICRMLQDPIYTGRYTGQKYTTVSYKNHKPIVRPPEDWIVIENHHPAIVDIETFETAQRLRGHRTRSNRVGEKSTLSGLVRCADCGSVMSYSWQGANGEFSNFVCKSYRSGNVYRERQCTRHGISVTDVEKIVLAKIQDVVAFAIRDEEAFAFKVHKAVNADTERAVKGKGFELGKTKRRIDELDKIISRIYEDHVCGKLSEDRFSKMLQGYETEQSALIATAETLRAEIAVLNEKIANITSFMKMVRRYGRITELTGETARAFVEKVVVHEAVKESGKKRKKLSQQVDIYFTHIGQLNID